MNIARIGGNAPATPAKKTAAKGTETAETKKESTVDRLELQPPSDSGERSAEEEELFGHLSDGAWTNIENDEYGHQDYLRGSWTCLEDEMKHFQGTAEEKRAFHDRRTAEILAYQAEQDAKQDALLAKLEPTPAYQDYLLNGISRVYYQEEYYDPEVFKEPLTRRFFLLEFLKKKVDDGIPLTEEEKDACPRAASREYSHKHDTYEDQTEPYARDFAETLRRNGLSLQEGETLSLRFDRYYRFTVSGVDETRAKKIEELINANVSLRTALVEDLYGRTDNSGHRYFGEGGSEFKNTLNEFNQFRNVLWNKEYIVERFHYRYEEATFCGYIGKQPIYKNPQGEQVSRGEANQLDVLRKMLENLPASFSGFQEPPITFDGKSFHAME